jgi:hypothetical protein
MVLCRNGFKLENSSSSFIKKFHQKNEIEISACFRKIFYFELNEKRSQAEPSRAEKPSAQAMA